MASQSYQNVGFRVQINDADHGEGFLKLVIDLFPLRPKELYTKEVSHIGMFGFVRCR